MKSVYPLNQLAKGPLDAQANNQCMTMKGKSKMLGVCHHLHMVYEGLNKEDSLVFHILLNRPSKRNTLSPELFSEFPRALSSLDHNPTVNVVVLSGAGDNFCGGIDLSELKASERFLSGNRGCRGERIR
ncbi:hypothetical protein F8388_017966 [Cannabis sativa]|uniref:Uncharacterized protein n=1 Tax=Cannabis sativa TaxID=3483 RepID=A0A7J6E5C5_CANSA|nr:hypothetical protein F8388_017966 [Cannabis sativa]